MDCDFVSGVTLITLPPEIIDTIVDQLRDDPVSLRNCSLASKQFVSRTQKHLFSTIKLFFSFRSIQHGAQAILDVLNNNPSLSRHVRSLHLENYFEGVWDEQTEELCWRTDEVFPHIFSHLHSLTTLLLKGAFELVMLADQEHLSDLSPHLTSALFRMLRSNKVSEISIERITNFPIGHLALTCRHLKRLSLDSLDSSNPFTDAEVYGRSITSYDEIELQDTSENGKLEVLTISRRSALSVTKFHEFASRPKSRVTLSQLRNLVVRGHSAFMRQIAATIIAEAATFLEEFLWHYNFDLLYAAFDPGAMDLAITTRLRVIGFACLHTQWSDPTHLTWISQSLSRIRGDNNLEELIIVLSCDLPLDSAWIESADWASSFDSLTTSHGFQRLHRVAIFIDFSPADRRGRPVSYDYATVSSQLERRLPRLQDSGLLSILYVVNESLQGTLEYVVRMVGEFGEEKLPGISLRIPDI